MLGTLSTLLILVSCVLLHAKHVLIKKKLASFVRQIIILIVAEIVYCTVLIINLDLSRQKSV